MYYLKAVFIVFMITILSCDLFLTGEDSSSVNIYPRISFAENSKYSLESIQLLKVYIIIDEEDTTVKTFNFKDGKGNLGAIKIKTKFEILIFGCDIDTNALFKGVYLNDKGIYVNDKGITDDTYTLYFNKEMITPLKPSNFRLIVLSDKKIRFTWEDNSNNEDGFYLIRKDTINKTSVKTTIIENNTLIDIGREPKHYHYIIEAYNKIGSSYNPDTIKWYWDDKLEIGENTLITPLGPGDKYQKDKPYLFQIEPVQTETETCPRGHRVQYKFDFDDDSTDWTGPRGYVYIWKSSGKKRIRFMKRCSKNRYAESDWSPPVEIEVK